MSSLKFTGPLRRRRSSKSNPNPFGVSVRKAGRRTLISPVTQPAGSLGEGEAEPLPASELSIQGKRVGSLYEWRLAKALDAIGLEYQYLVTFFGGRRTRGSLEVDFLVNTVPLPTPVFADGEHWHDGQLAREDSLKRARLNAEMAGVLNPWVAFYGPALHSQEAAMRAVREIFR